jgi:hypothetical protein
MPPSRCLTYNARAAPIPKMTVTPYFLRRGTAGVEEITMYKREILRFINLPRAHSLILLLSFRSVAGIVFGFLFLA